MTDDQYKNLMYAISLDIAVKIKPQPKIDTSQLRGAAIDAVSIIKPYHDWAKAIQNYLMNPPAPL